MTEPHDPNDALERLIDDVLRSQPPLQAPRNLQTRVLAEIEQRTRSPWWYRSFAYWPLLARLAVIALCLGAVEGSLAVFAWADGSLQPMQSIVFAASDVSAVLINLIPVQWLAAGLSVCAALWAALFGLSTAAYRTLRK